MQADFKYCPYCTSPLVEKNVFGAWRQVCSNPECGFVLFLEPKLVAAALVEHQGKILLGRRAMNPGKGRWSFPSGYVDRFEKVELAALREVKEETNLDVQIQDLVGVYSEKGNPVVLMVFHALVKGGIEAMAEQKEEVSELRFYDPTDLPELAFPFDHSILEDWRRKQKG